MHCSACFDQVLMIVSMLLLFHGITYGSRRWEKHWLHDWRRMLYGVRPRDSGTLIRIHRERNVASRRNPSSGGTHSSILEYGGILGFVDALSVLIITARSCLDFIALAVLVVECWGASGTLMGTGPNAPESCLGVCGMSSGTALNVAKRSGGVRAMFVVDTPLNLLVWSSGEHGLAMIRRYFHNVR